jgi:hypothetical protein
MTQSINSHPFGPVFALVLGVGLSWLCPAPSWAGILAPYPLRDLGVIEAGSSVPVIVSFASTASRPTQISAVSVLDNGNGTARILTDGCSGTNLLQDEVCSVIVEIMPERPGEFAALVIADTDAGLPARVSLSAASRPAGVVTATLDPGVGLSAEAEVSFGTRAGTRAVVATNMTGREIRLGRLELVGGDKAGMTLGNGTCREDLVLPAGESCAIEVSWSAPLDGSRSADLLIWHDGPRRISRTALKSERAIANATGPGNLPPPPPTLGMLQDRKKK